MSFRIVPDGAFSLAAAAAFDFGPNTGRPTPSHGEMRLAFVVDDLHHQAGVLLRQDPDGTVLAEVEGDAPLEIVERQVRRILSLDCSSQEWAAVGVRDPVIGELQRQHPGLRPVLFHSPYEAAAWSILSTRRHRRQAAALRTRIAESFGQTFELGGEHVHSFPLPQQLLALDSIPGLDDVRVKRLHAVARSALDGALVPEALRAAEPRDALAQLQELPGIGPTYATLILIRSTGATDTLTLTEPRLPSYAAHFYRLGSEPASEDQLRRITDRWRPFRTWAAVLVRVAGDRADLPFQRVGA